MKNLIATCTIFLLLSSLVGNLQASELKIGAYNIRNFDYDERERISTDKDALAKILSSLNFDLLSVEEIDNVPVFKDFIRTKFKEYAVELTQCGGEHGQHLGFVYNPSKLKLNSFRQDLRFTDGCNSGVRPAAVADFTEIGTGLNFIAIALHLKSGPKFFDKRYQSLLKVMEIVNEQKKSGKQNFVILGDLNTTEFLDHGEGYRRFTQLLNSNGFATLSDRLKCTAYWWGGSEDGMESPSVLDHIIVNNSFKGQYKSVSVEAKAHCKISRCQVMSPTDLGISYTGVSDHCPLLGTFR